MIVLNCGHKFNYDPLFQDIYNHKKRFSAMETMRLKEFQIRCPYCRKIQNELMPYYKGKRKVYGVNSNANMVGEKFVHMKTPSLWGFYYKNYAKGYCCWGIDSTKPGCLSNPEGVVTCVDTMVKYNDIDNMVYCKKHMKMFLDKTFTQQTRNMSRQFEWKRRKLQK